jgi:hypothetical protein
VTPGKEQLAELTCGVARSGYEFLSVVTGEERPTGGAFLTHC